MKSANVVYKKVEIANWSSTGKNVTHRNISCLCDGLIDGKFVTGYETFNFTHSLATAKKVIDALLACGTPVLNGRLVMTVDQVLCLTQICEFGGKYPQDFINEKVAKIMEVK
tara:strand:+ start:125 stop:460 length:336 start_codon:yes stop_codon:yes gene_type:complete